MNRRPLMLLRLMAHFVLWVRTMSPWTILALSRLTCGLGLVQLSRIVR